MAHNLPRKTLLLPARKGKLVPAGNLKFIYTNFDLGLTPEESVYLASENNAYAIAKLGLPEKANKEIMAQKLVELKMTSSEFESLEDKDYLIYPIYASEIYNSPRLILYSKDLVKDYNVITDFELPFDKVKSDYYSNEKVRFEINSENIKDSFEFIVNFLSQHLNETPKYDLAISIVSNSANVVSFDNYSENLSFDRNSMVFSIPRGLSVKLVKNANICKIFTKDFGDITNKLIGCAEECLKIPYDYFKADCILNSENLSETTLNKIMSDNKQTLDNFELILFDVECADFNSLPEEPLSRLKLAKPLAIGLKSFSVVSAVNASNSGVIKELYSYSRNGIAIITGEYSSVKHYIKNRGVEMELSANDIKMNGKSYCIKTDLGDISSSIPVSKEYKFVALVGESVFEVLDGGYNATDRERQDNRNIKL